MGRPEEENQKRRLRRKPMIEARAIVRKDTAYHGRFFLVFTGRTDRKYCLTVEPSLMYLVQCTRRRRSVPRFSQRTFTPGPAVHPAW